MEKRKITLMQRNGTKIGLPILEQQFALVADDGSSQEAKGGHLMRETENCYSMWW